MKRSKPLISVREVRDYFRTGGKLNPEDMPFCDRVLEEGSLRARMYLALFIHFHPSESGFRVLRTMLEDEDLRVQLAAVDFFRACRDPAVYGLMLEKAQSPDFQIRGAAMLTAIAQPGLQAGDLKEFFYCEPNKYGKLIACYGMLKLGVERPYLKFLRRSLRSASLLQKETVMYVFEELLSPEWAQLFYDDVAEVLCRQSDLHLALRMEGFLRRLEADPALEVQPRPWNLGPRALARIPVEEGSAYYRGVLLRQIQTGRTGDQLENMTALLARLGEPSGPAKEEGEKGRRPAEGRAETSGALDI